MAKDEPARISLIATDPEPPPYPPNIRAKGWRFELDLERIDQSDTWAVAPQELRPWLLMMWATAWRQHPCGAFSADEKVIAAKIGMNWAMWQHHREILMRGWWRASDGRLYHPAITERVHALLGMRERENQWKRKQRLRTNVQPDAEPTPDGIHAESLHQNQNHISTSKSFPSSEALGAAKHKKSAVEKEDQNRAKWWDSEHGIAAKGKELGLEARPGEDWRQFTSRIFNVINEKRRQT